jgi:hypothetical protein
MVSLPFDLDSKDFNSSDKLFIMSPTKEVWAKIEGASDVSQ